MMACQAAQMAIGVLIAPIRVNSRIDQYPGMAWPPTVPSCTRYASAAFKKFRMLRARFPPLPRQTALRSVGRVKLRPRAWFVRRIVGVVRDGLHNAGLARIPGWPFLRSRQSML